MKKLIFLFMIHTAFLYSYPQMVRNSDLVYDDNIQGIIFNKLDYPLDKPFIQLGSSDKLRLAFDDMSNQSYIFKYTFVHCDSEWKTSKLDQMEYLDGYFEDEILDYEFSLNAIPGYIHYEAVLPRRNMVPKLSGNYILKVYLNDASEENVLFTRRFYVVEPLTEPKVAIPFYPINLEFLRTKQQIDLSIFVPDLFNSEPMQRFKVNIQQNGRWDNMKVGLKPTSITSNFLVYNYPEGIVFDGGNDFRRFNMESFYYQSMYIKEIISEADGYDVILHTDYSRKSKPYETLGDLNGRRIIRAREEQSTAIEGEYAWVFFALKSPRIENVTMYLLGELNDWHLNEKSKMEYNSSARQYEGALYLKQGYYEYLYAALPEGKTRADVTLIEGDHWEADNDYTVFVYYREIVPEYDRLVGLMTINSRAADR